MGNGHLIKQPHPKACLPTALSYLIDVPLQRIFDFLGHDGRLQGFTHGEVALAALNCGWTYTRVAARPSEPRHAELMRDMVMRNKSGVITVSTTGLDHALAKFDSYNIYDTTTAEKVDLDDLAHAQITGYAAVYSI